MKPEETYKMADPPRIDPHEYALDSRYWGENACHLVRYEGRYYVWLAGAGRGGVAPLVYPMPGEEPARAFLDDWQAAHLLHTPWDERVAYIFLLDPGRGPGAQEVRAAPDAGLRGGGATGILYALRGGGGRGRRDLGGQLRRHGRGQRPAFASQVRRARRGTGHVRGVGRTGRLRVQRDRTGRYPDLVAGILRYRATDARMITARGS